MTPTIVHAAQSHSKAMIESAEPVSIEYLTNIAAAINWCASINDLPPELQAAPVLDAWEIFPHGPLTEVRELQGALWLLCSQYGAVSFSRSSRALALYLNPNIDRIAFDRLLLRVWLPTIYQTWGYQVLHASAAWHMQSGSLVAFTGPTHAGKSTLGYGLGARPGWQQIADDSLAFSVDADEISFIPIPNTISLRPDSAQFYKEQAYSYQLLDWPRMSPKSIHIYLIEVDSRIDEAAGIETLSRVEAYPLLLQQAYVLTSKLHDLNRRSLKDYLALLRKTSTYRLEYRQTFSDLETILEMIEYHAL